MHHRDPERTPLHTQMQKLEDSEFPHSNILSGKVSRATKLLRINAKGSVDLLGRAS